MWGDTACHVGVGNGLSSSAHAFLAHLNLAITQYALCDQFEQAWKSGPRPDIADYLPQIPTQYAGQLLEHLVAVDAELRSAVNERPRLDDYLARFSHGASRRVWAHGPSCPTVREASSDFRTTDSR